MYDHCITMQFDLNKIYQAYIDSIKSRNICRRWQGFYFGMDMVAVSVIHIDRSDRIIEKYIIVSLKVLHRRTVRIYLLFIIFLTVFNFLKFKLYFKYVPTLFFQCILAVSCYILYLSVCLPYACVKVGPFKDKFISYACTYATENCKCPMTCTENSQNCI